MAGGLPLPLRTAQGLGRELIASGEKKNIEKKPIMSLSDIGKTKDIVKKDNVSTKAYSFPKHPYEKEEYAKMTSGKLLPTTGTKNLSVTVEPGEREGSYYAFLRKNPDGTYGNEWDERMIVSSGDFAPVESPGQNTLRHEQIHQVMSRYPSWDTEYMNKLDTAYRLNKLITPPNYWTPAEGIVRGKQNTASTKDYLSNRDEQMAYFMEDKTQPFYNFTPQQIDSVLNVPDAPSYLVTHPNETQQFSRLGDSMDVDKHSALMGVYGKMIQDELQRRYAKALATVMKKDRSLPSDASVLQIFRGR